MEFNPYESPDAIDVAEAVWSTEERQLWQVALWQKYLMWFLLVFVISNVLLGTYFFHDVSNEFPNRILSDSAVLIGGIVFFVSWCVVTLSLVKMELIRHNRIAAGGVVIGMLVPGLNLFVLLGINGSATNFLRKSHVRVGLFGAEMGDIRRNLKKKVGESDPDKASSDSNISIQTQEDITANMALPVEPNAAPMVAKMVPEPDISLGSTADSAQTHKED